MTILDTVGRWLDQLHDRWAGTGRYRLLAQLERAQYDPPAMQAQRQWLAVQKLLTHCYQTVPFYRQRFTQVRLHPNDFRSLADLVWLPILTKADIRAHEAELRSEVYAPKDLFAKTTSGSTGVPLRVWVDQASMRFKQACTQRSDEWTGWRRGQRVAKAWGNPEYVRQGFKGRLRNALIDRACYLDTLDLTEAKLDAFAAHLARYQPPLLFGHAHSLYLVAQHVEQLGLRVRPAGMISTAMPLHDFQRQLIERVFGCKVLNRYGCEEASLLACQCSATGGLHLNADSVYVELEALPNTPADTGKVLVTDLTNYAMPLLRYQVGDVASRQTEPCSCGRTLPLLARVEGREADYVRTPAGNLISGISLTENFALHIPHIAQLQIVQEQRDLVRFRIVPADDFGPASERKLQGMVRDVFGPTMRHELELIDAIEQEPSGKYRFCISRVA